ncbi:MAG TPA: RNA methyltransferase, partial [Rhodothermales bacterium]|nr:RNA methyltransferase [Rhodothermales bacterium]
MPDPAEEAAREMEALLAAARQPLIDNEAFIIAGQRLAPKRIVEILSPLMTEARLARIDAVLAKRTYTVVPVVEGLVNTGNVNAVMRSAEALGYQGFHIITNDEDGTRYKSSSRTSQGAEKWLDVRLWPTPTSCAEHLKTEGYRIVATHLDDAAVPIDTLDFTQPTALVFGNELHGLTPKMVALADQTCIVPMA